MTTSNDIGERQIINVPLPHAAVLQARAFKPVARQQQHVERKIEAKPALDFMAEQFEHTPGAGAEIEQGAERLVGERGADRLLDRIVRDMQFADPVPLDGMSAEVSLCGGSARLTHGGETCAVTRDCLVGWIEPIDQRTSDVGAATMLGKTEEGPGPLTEAFDQAGLGEKPQVARNTWLRLSKDVGEIGHGELRLRQQRYNAQACLLTRRLERRIEGIETEFVVAGHETGPFGRAPTI
jgi:hypothetical protein